jgi:hypothetical protein
VRKTLASFWSTSILLICSMAVGSAATITIDENGNGNIDGTALPFTTTGTNPLPPGQSPVLIYTLPFTGVAGNVSLIEPETGVRGDVLQFTGNGTVIFYSATDSDSSADRFEPPIFPFPVANSVSFPETTSGNADGLFYTPTAGQPGFDSSGPTYHFISDVTTTTIPEPASAGLLFLGAGALLMKRFGRG